ncbi:radical SAM protein [Virgibacillus dakarensis]|nr:radical SAM protein [Virgibacillus dakarensis]
MRVFNDIITIDGSGKSLIYNHEWNKAVIVNDRTKNHLLNDRTNNIKENLSYLSEEEIRALENSGIIYNDNDGIYEQNKYKYTLMKRNADVNIKTVYFHITQRCNLKCSYCYNMENLNKPDKLTTNDIKSIINQLKSLSVQTIIFTGGEVLLRRDIVELCEHVKLNNMKCQVLSNGVLLHKRKELLKFVDKFIISLDTMHEENNLRTGLNIPRLLDNLRNIPDQYKSKFIVRSVVSKTGESDWKEVANYVENHVGMKHLVTPFIPNSHEDIKYMADLDSLPTNDDDCNLSGNVCGASYQIVGIDSNGDIYPCQCLIKDKLLIANIMENEWLSKLKSSSVTTGFQNRTVLDIEGCATCEVKYLCGGGCRAISENVYGNLESRVEFLCEFQKKIAYNKLKGLLKTYG